MRQKQYDKTFKQVVSTWNFTSKISASGQFWIFAKTELPINEEKVFQTSVPVSDGNNLIHNINNINIEELYCFVIC